MIWIQILRGKCPKYQSQDGRFIIVSLKLVDAWAVGDNETMAMSGNHRTLEAAKTWASKIKTEPTIYAASPVREE